MKICLFGENKKFCGMKICVFGENEKFCVATYFKIWRLKIKRCRRRDSLKLKALGEGVQ
jgi:hypothetical protein